MYILRSKMVEGRFTHLQRLQELRNIQEQISRKRAQLNKEKDTQDKRMEEKRLELQKKQSGYVFFYRHFCHQCFHTKISG
ncbi:hypothetical protein SK128_002775 [Halocaridina rubra]|uniref:Uncharacterized protein n=1 Tax=Halocaridina rubra TaxID=373956 RepID=A0AAN8X770_HALRR